MEPAALKQAYNGSWQAIALGRSTSSSTTWPPTKRKPSAHSWSIIRRGGCTSRRPIRRGSTTSSFGFRRSRWFRWRDTNDAVWYVGDPAEVDAISHHNRIHLAIVELMSFPTGPSVHNEKASALTIVKLRDTSPEAVIASFGDEEKIRESLGTLPAEVSLRLSHYYRLRREDKRTCEGKQYEWHSRSADVGSMKELLAATRRRHERYESDTGYRAKYRYDVALSFAGEDRAELAGRQGFDDERGVSRARRSQSRDSCRER